MQKQINVTKSQRGHRKMKYIKIKSIKPIGKEDVYNMEVENHHNFSVNGGLIVHNCYDSFGYGLLAYHVQKSRALPKPETRIEKYKNSLIKSKKGKKREF